MFGVVPNAGSTAGGNTVTISGTNFGSWCYGRVRVHGFTDRHLARRLNPPSQVVARRSSRSRTMVTSAGLTPTLRQRLVRVRPVGGQRFHASIRNHRGCR